MKNTFLWMCGILVGMAIGYGLSFVVPLSVYLLVLGGFILGSSVAITYNIYREEPGEDVSETFEDDSASSP
jgi:hypothetical protein